MTIPSNEPTIKPSNMFDEYGKNISAGDPSNLAVTTSNMVDYDRTADTPNVEQPMETFQYPNQSIPTRPTIGNKNQPTESAPNRNVSCNSKKVRKALLAIALIIIVIVAITFGYDKPSATSASRSTDADGMVEDTKYPPGFEIACNFISQRKLSECQTITSFDTSFQTTTVTGDTIPYEIGLLTQLTYLDLRNTVWSSSGGGTTTAIPASIGNLTLLTHLDFSDISLTGTIPSSIGNLVQLQSLDVRSNQLNGTIPSTLGNLKKLGQLDLRFNQLTGSIPSTFGNLTQLQDLILNENQLSGSIPATIGNLIRLTTLSLWGNQLTDRIPTTLGKLIQLTYLGLHDNQLNGTIPSTLGHLTQLNELYLSDNALTGSIPSELANLGRLTIFDLHNNTNLNGTIPASFCTMEAEIRIILDCENISCSCCINGNDLQSCP